ncbi:acetyl-CoA synthetase isoform [Ascoidea rubescens DSM 1968]|uniref:Acetyl-coenzyme A synthetase n=1 Tax=Ascoidea rubescens DSM 1968 TaxID=1344418 RepID=A0A1D2VEH8_9ASCO|nr:acetyl-CoA synthetase isoform [Ascoidea rubescens DSM 1968]ODV60036.1 acetyl-CoA synthetase isoform [Ascoidea rubescens DSM 1968]
MSHHDEHLSENVSIVQPPVNFFKKRPDGLEPYIKSFEEYQTLYQQSIREPNKFYSEQAREHLTWFKDFDIAKWPEHGFENSWFVNGELNASYNCVDRHAFKNPDKPAIIYEGDEPGTGRTVTYGELLELTCRAAQILINIGIKKGDTVAVYLPMVPETIATIMAINRIGAIHSVVFAGFSATALRDRINDAKSTVVFTADQSVRGGRAVETKRIVDQAIKECPQVKNVVVFKRTGDKSVPFDPKIDLWWHEEIIKYKPYVPPVAVNSEDPLYLLYTSGSTGKPKGLVHTTAGYLVNAVISAKYVFDIHPEDTVFTAADIGWVLGHTYVAYAPLAIGATTVMYEGTPVYPTPTRFWDIIDDYKCTQFYVAPTALRLLKRAGDHHIAPYDLSTLRALGTVGEPIAPDVWEWYYETISRKKASILDTFWQTETGGPVLGPLAGVTPLKPGSCSFPFFGVECAILDPQSGEELTGNEVEGILAFKTSWPSIARTVWKDYNRYLETYFKPFPGYFFTGDGAARDKDGFFWILGRVDDVVNVSGHRLSTAEIEAAILENPAVAESAAVGIPNDLTGQAVISFVSLKAGVTPEQIEKTKLEMRMTVRKEIGPFAAPKEIFIVDDLPKTRSGKIMRRILRKILVGEEDQLGDVSTLSNPQCVDDLINLVKTTYRNK